MPHIHAVSWISSDYLIKEGCTTDGKTLDTLDKHPELALAIAKKLIHVTIPENDEKLKEKVLGCQTHGHRPTSCYKGSKKSKCRFNFPKLPSEKWLIAEPLPEDMDEKDAMNKMYRFKEVLEKAMEIINDKNIDDNMTFQQFIKILHPKVKPKNNPNYDYYACENEYYLALSTSETGKILISKRSVKERNINNYNPEWLKAWNANMDIQIAFDPYAVITYIISYVGKDETMITSFLKEALRNAKKLPWQEKLKSLSTAFITHRQCGMPESIYRTLKELHLKESNIACTFVSSGFPEHRHSIYHPVPEDPDQPNDEFMDAVGEVQIEGRTGTFKKQVPISQRYAERPKVLNEMCLAQFAQRYGFIGTVPKSVEFDKHEVSIDKESEEEDFIFTFGASQIQLPKYFKVANGYMRKHKPLVLRFHNSKRKEGHEEQYSELFLYYPWRTESKNIPRNHDECIEKFNAVEQIINSNKQALFPFRSTIELMDEVVLEDIRANHIFDNLDPEFEQEKEDGISAGVQQDEEFDHRNYDFDNQDRQGGSFEDFRYKSIEVNKQDMDFLLDKLDPEQRIGLDKIVKYCKALKRAKKNPLLEVEPLYLIIHGGAGIKVKSNLVYQKNQLILNFLQVLVNP